MVGWVGVLVDCVDVVEIGWTDGFAEIAEEIESGWGSGGESESGVAIMKMVDEMGDELGFGREGLRRGGRGCGGGWGWEWKGERGYETTDLEVGEEMGVGFCW